MARRTKPVPKQVTDPKLPSIAFLKGRLIDFDTGSPALEAQHRDWLAARMKTAMTNSMYRVRLVGYASKIGDIGYNERLSYDRITNVARFIEGIDRAASDRIETFRAVGEMGYEAAESDDSADWRAVEVHIFIGDIPPPPPPPNLKPVPRRRPPLPGGQRFTEWEVATPGGVLVAEGGGFGFNVFFIRNIKQAEMRGYIQPVLGIGAGASIKGLKLIWSVVQTIVTGIQASAVEFTKVTPKVAVTWEEMEACLVRVSGAGGGVIVGGGVTIVTFIPAFVWQYNHNDVPLKLPLPGDGVLFQFRSIGQNWQVGVNASMVLGPLVRVD